MNPRLPYTQNPDPTYAGYERAISEQLLVFPGFRIWWQQSRSVFSPGFVTRIDALIESVPESGIHLTGLL